MFRLCEVQVMGNKYFFRTKGGLYRKLVSSSLAAAFTASAFSSSVNAAVQTKFEKIWINSWDSIKKHKKISIAVVTAVLVVVIGSVIVSQVLRKDTNTQPEESNDQGKDENKDKSEKKEEDKSQNEEEGKKETTIEEKEKENVNEQGKATFSKTKAIKIGAAATGAGAVIVGGGAFAANRLIKKSSKDKTNSDAAEGSNQDINTSVQAEKEKEEAGGTDNLLSDNSNVNDIATDTNKLPNQNDVDQGSDNTNEVESLATETEGDEVIGTLDNLDEN